MSVLPDTVIGQDGNARCMVFQASGLYESSRAVERSDTPGHAKNTPNPASFHRRGPMTQSHPHLTPRRLGP